MKGCSILVVDDEEELRELIRLVLEAAGHMVATASDGKDARRVLARGRYDVVLTDLLMPESDGLELIAELVKKGPAVRIIAMSGGGHIAGDQYLQMAKSFGAHVLLRKAFTHDRLLAAIEEARAGAEPRDTREGPRPVM
jgi:DNA-binding NtrC family response regulator